MKVNRIIACFAAAAMLAGSITAPSVKVHAENKLSKTVTIDGNNANANPQNRYRGLGMVAANNSSRLLLDYKDENPDRYWEIMNYLFNTETGMGLSHIKIEMGSDVNSSSGTEPSLKRTEDEVADPTRGANYQMAADAKTINPNITLDMIWWSEPLWVKNAEDKNAARYQWYKETLDACYNVYGLKFDYVSANRNERTVDNDWIIYLSNGLKSEKNCPYDYSKIKIVAADEVGAWGIADQMLKNENLMNAVDVLASHYTSWSNDKVKQISEEYGKEVWFAEGSSPMSYSQGTYKYDGTGTGLSDINGMLDIATRIITMYPGGLMNLYEFQPAVASYYSGATYFPKQLITANEPWTGYYTLDAGFYMTMHFTQFAKVGWQYVDGACEGDGVAGGDGHAIVDSTYNYQTVMDPETGDYSVVIANNSANTIAYTFDVSNLAKNAAAVDVWETRGPEDDTNYYQNFLKKIDTITPVDKGNGTASYTVEVKPYSLVTLSTLEVAEQEFKAPTESTILELPYSDDFEYTAYDENYLAERGYAPRFTTDAGGAFEVVDLNGNKVLQQKVTYHIKAVDWGRTPIPVTNLGDDSWTNYSVSVDALFSTEPIGNEKRVNYIGVGARYILADLGNSGYWLQLYDDGTYKLNKQSKAVVTSETPLEGFDKTAWYNLKMEVNKNVVTCFINDEQVIQYIDQQAVIASGRVALYSEFNTNYFDNLKVEAIDGTTPYSVRLDDTDEPLTYEGAWEHATMSGFKNFNRTISNGTAGASLSFDYTGEGFAMIGGVAEEATIQVEIDGEMVETGYVIAVNGNRETSYYNYNLAEGEHSVTITVLSGNYAVDAVEIVRAGNNKKFLTTVAEVTPEVTAAPVEEEKLTTAPADASAAKEETKKTGATVPLLIVGGLLAGAAAVLLIAKSKKK